MNQEDRAFECEALIGETQIIAIEVMGMRFENEQLMIEGQNMAYMEASFLEKADQVRIVVNKLRNLSENG